MASQQAETIKVFARIRPSKESQVHKVVSNAEGSRTLKIALDKDEKNFEFDGVFGENADQERVFEEAAFRTVHGTLNGYNGTIFAYGQTGSGKTHTMIGRFGNAEDPREAGVIPRGIRLLFDELEQKGQEMEGHFSSTIAISFIEIYNEHIFDLLDLKEEKLKPGQDRDGNVCVNGAKEQVAKDLNDAMEIVNLGWSNRRVAETKMNRESSRSHALLLIKIRTVEVHGSISTSRSAFLNLVDLAGSERVSQSKVEGERLRETTNINKSLLMLGTVIRELSDKKKTGFIAFRNSTLTHLLKDSLGGNARTTVMINVHPDKMYYSETMSTLQFSAAVKKIENKVVVNEDLKGDSVTAYTDEIKRLHEQIESLKGSCAASVAEKERQLGAWKEAASVYERQLAVARRHAVNTAILARKKAEPVDSAAEKCETLWQQSMNEVAESARKLDTSHVGAMQLREISAKLEHAEFEKTELQCQLDAERKARGELQERINNLLKEGTMSPRRGRQDSSSSQEERRVGRGPVSSMLDSLEHPLLSSSSPSSSALAALSARKKERRTTMYTPSSKKRQTTFFKQISGADGESSVEPVSLPEDAVASADSRELELELEVNMKQQVIDEKSQECEGLKKLLDDAEKRAAEAEDAAATAAKTIEEQIARASELATAAAQEREKMAELRRAHSQLEEEMEAAIAQIERLERDTELLRSTHEDDMRELQARMTSNLSHNEKKEMELKTEIDGLNDGLASLRVDLQNKITEKEAAEEILTMLRDKLLKASEEKTAKEGEVAELTAQLEEERAEREASERKREEEQRESARSHAETVAELERRMEERERETEEARRAIEEMQKEGATSTAALTRELEQLRIAKDAEMAAAATAAAAETANWRTVSDQFAAKMNEMKQQFSHSEDRRKEAEAREKLVAETLSANTAENAQLREDLAALSSHTNSKQKIHMMQKYLIENAQLKTEKAVLEAELTKHGLAIPGAVAAARPSLPEDEERGGAEENRPPLRPLPARRTARVVSSAAAAAAASASSSAVAGPSTSAASVGASSSRSSLRSSTRAASNK